MRSLDVEYASVIHVRFLNKFWAGASRESGVIHAWAKPRRVWKLTHDVRSANTPFWWFMCWIMGALATSDRNLVYRYRGTWTPKA